jgi:hypothetical protein
LEISKISVGKSEARISERLGISTSFKIEWKEIILSDKNTKKFGDKNEITTQTIIVDTEKPIIFNFGKRNLIICSINA